jgi:Saxitoxin biosynthesis operon protein SxtJ
MVRGGGLARGVRAGLSTHDAHSPKADARELRRFGLLMAAVIAGLFGGLLPLLKGHAPPVWPWVLAAMFLVPALAVPKALGPVHRAWMWVGHWVGWFNTRVLLSIVFYLVVTPMGLALRALGRDPMARRAPSGAASHRRPSAAAPRERMERPY